MIPRTFLNPPTGVLPFDMFRRFAPTMGDPNSLSPWVPLCDIYETDQEIVLKMELPEMKRDDVRLTLEKNVLTIRGERKFEAKVEQENYHRVERHYGQFVRSFSVPSFIEETKILAEFKDGVLTVTMPKNESATPKHIELKIN
ncbi:MAG TPA: Hsp20/alpha crystallin family protein [Pyrinomonadaceae bacterium]|nr:Hsp20/alpha crystallin family protein [Pyrinomonadaceae bacterium]